MILDMDWIGENLAWSFDPLEALARWPARGDLAMLHSGRLSEPWSRWSIMARPAAVYRFMPAGQSQWYSQDVPCPVSLTHKPLTDLKRLLDHTDGLWIGSLSYDLGRWIEHLPEQAIDDRHWPIIELGWCPSWLVHDGLKQRWLSCGDPRTAQPDLAVMQPRRATFQSGPARSVFTREAYLRTVQRVLDYIAAGDVFQVNLAQRLTASFQSDWPDGPRALFQALATASPAWYGAFLQWQHPAPGSASGKSRAIASTSPELFLRVDPDRQVLTRPIKGTRPASVDRNELLHSEKDIAELNMIVDLMRNDLGRVCDYGSVRVVEPRTIESHPTVHHGVAGITGRLHPSKHLTDLLAATLPGGSVTGAPKVRAMQIIDELEPVRRGPYCGSIGYLSKSHSQLNIAIRSMMLDQAAGRVDFSVGGGIVADSNPQAELDETMDKAAAMLKALGQSPPG